MLIIDPNKLAILVVEATIYLCEPMILDKIVVIQRKFIFYNFKIRLP